MPESIFVNKKTYFEGNRVIKGLGGLVKSASFGHGTCDCGKENVDLLNIEFRSIMSIQFWNGKEKDAMKFSLGSECMERLGKGEFA